MREGAEWRREQMERGGTPSCTCMPFMLFVGPRFSILDSSENGQGYKSLTAEVKGEGQGRGNSGVFLASTGKGDTGYELHV